MMIAGVIQTFAICRLHRFHWPWFSLLGYLALPLLEICFFSRPVCLVDQFLGMSLLSFKYITLQCLFDCGNKVAGSVFCWFTKPEIVKPNEGKPLHTAGLPSFFAATFSNRCCRGLRREPVFPVTSINPAMLSRRLKCLSSCHSGGF